MRRTTRLNIQIALPSAVVILLLGGLLAFMLPQLSEIRNQNRNLQEWTWAIEHTRDAIYATKQARVFLEALTDGQGDRDDLLFDIAEQKRHILENATHPQMLSLLKPETQTFLTQRADALRNDETLKFDETLIAVTELTPRLEAALKFFNAEKWGAYIRYYESVNSTTSRLITISLAVLVVAILSSIVLTLWSIIRTKQRLSSIVEASEKKVDVADTAARGQGQTADPLDKLVSYLDNLTDRLAHAGDAEKILTIVENERKRIAMDMHDEVLSELTALSREISELKEQPASSDSERRAHYQAVEERLEFLTNGIRSVIDDLHPYALDSLGLEAAIQSFVEKHVSRDGKGRFSVHLGEDLERFLNDSQRVNLYRVALEVLQNIVRHANATRCEVTMHVADGMLIMIIEDNGDGFDPDRVMAGNAHGLINIEERAKTLGARVRWQKSRFSRGVRFELRMPVGLIESKAAE